jgi:formylglycine-generating enzyme required for sulfatase activity
MRKPLLLIVAAALYAGTLGHAPAAAPTTAPATTARDEMVRVQGGTFKMGTENGHAYEAPVHDVALKSFHLDRHEVTVRQFRAFIEATGYKTDAEKYGWSGVFDPKQKSWTRVDGATWAHPEGPQSTPKDDEPVCQVSWTDAAAYAKWAGKRLPTEAEFEYAQRAGLVGKTYSWGDELRPNGKIMANYWQGRFPDKDLAEDGFPGRAPVMTFPPNGYGLYDMTGNVWEWCSDWYADDYYAKAPKENPTGPATGEERAMRGGSWLCAENYCTNYRVAGRSHSTPDTGLNNLGFRCAKDAE